MVWYQSTRKSSYSTRETWCVIYHWLTTWSDPLARRACLAAPFSAVTLSFLWIRLTGQRLSQSLLQSPFRTIHPHLCIICGSIITTRFLCFFDNFLFRFRWAVWAHIRSARCSLGASTVEAFDTAEMNQGAQPHVEFVLVIIDLSQSRLLNKMS